MSSKVIKLLVVDDSSLFRQMIISHLQERPEFEVVGYAVNSYDARHKILSLRPDVVTLDVEMPGQNGIDFLKEFLKTNSIPVVIVSSLNLTVFDALSAGAVDFVPKPSMNSPHSREVFFQTLIDKLRAAALSHVHHSLEAPASSAASVSNVVLPSGVLSSVVIGIGASTGGTEATLSVLEKLPARMPGIVVTQHMPPGFTDMYAKRLDRICRLEVKEAQNGDLIRPGLVLIAPGALQMEVVKTSRGYAVQCRPGAKVNGHSPSVDVLFSSIAKNVSCRTVGIILTGMGRDGADGLLKMRKNGAYTIGQDKESCVVYGMPMAAYTMGAVCAQASCGDIPSVLLPHLRK